MFNYKWPSLAAVVLFSTSFICVEASGDKVNGSSRIDVNSSGLQASNIISNLESGSSYSVRMGSAVWLHSLIQKDQQSIREVLSGDYTRLNELIPEVAFTKRFKDKSDRNLIYMKLRGFGSGMGAIFELVDDGNTGVVDLDLLSADLGLSSNQLSSSFQNPWEQALRSELARLNTETDLSRSLGGFENLRLVGPLNEMIEFPGVRADVQVSLAPYSVSGGDDALAELARGNLEGDLLGMVEEQLGEEMTYAMVKIEFMPVSTQQHLPDINGYLSDAKLMSVEHTAKGVMSAISTRAKGL